MIYYWSPIHGYGEKFKREAELVHEREQESEHQGNKDLL